MNSYVNKMDALILMSAVREQNMSLTLSYFIVTVSGVLLPQHLERAGQTLHRWEGNKGARSFPAVCPLRNSTPPW